MYDTTITIYYIIYVICYNIILLYIKIYYNVLFAVYNRNDLGVMYRSQLKNLLRHRQVTFCNPFLLGLTIMLMKTQMKLCNPQNVKNVKKSFYIVDAWIYFQLSLGSQGFGRLRLSRTNCIEPFYLFIYLFTFRK